MKHIATASAFVALIAGTAESNDGYAIETGAAINFSKSKDIQMVEEEILIELGKEKAHVQVDFIFRNHGNRQTVLMAFPDNGYNARIPTMEQVRSSVDGVSTKVEFRKTGGDPDRELESGLWTKKVHFEKGQTRSVRFEYDAQYGGTTAGNTFFDYILETGATWRGHIRKTTIELDWSNAGLSFAPAIVQEFRKGQRNTRQAAKGLQIQGTHATLKYTDFVPDFNLHVEFFPGFWHFELNGGLVPFPSDFLKTLGSPSDIWMPVETLGRFFCDANSEPWANPVTKKFGGSITFPTDSTALLGGRREVRLERDLVTKWRVHLYEPNYGAKMVRLRDLVAALGGSYRYDSSRALVVIAIPK